MIPTTGTTQLRQPASGNPPRLRAARPCRHNRQQMHHHNSQFSQILIVRKHFRGVTQRQNGPNRQQLSAESALESFGERIIRPPNDSFWQTIGAPARVARSASASRHNTYRDNAASAIRCKSGQSWNFGRSLASKTPMPTVQPLRTGN